MVIFKKHTALGSVQELGSMAPKTYRNKKIWHLPFVLLPRLTVFGFTLSDVSQCSMTDHDGKKDRVEPWQRTLESSDERPSQREIQIGRVVYLTSIAICNRVSIYDDGTFSTVLRTPSIG